MRFLIPATLLLVGLSGCEKESKEELVAPAASSAAPAAQELAAPAPAVEKKMPRIKTAAAPEKLGASSKEYGLAVGAPVPHASALNVAGETQTLEALMGGEPLLLIFYRGGWCPYCNFQIRAMAQSYKKIRARGVRVAMVSVDEVSESAKTEEAFELPFPTLSDASGAMHRAFKVYKKDKAVPSLYVLDQGKVRFVHVDEDHTKRPSEEQILLMLDELGYKEK